MQIARNSAELISCCTLCVILLHLLSKCTFSHFRPKSQFPTLFKSRRPSFSIPPLSENGKEAFRDLRGTLSSLTGINKRTLLSAHVVLG